jgi:hypothetical protein
MRRWAGILVVAGSILLYQGGAARAAVAFSLEGETLSANPSMSHATPTCDVGGTSTIAFSTAGVAIGPYPGTFTEAGSISFGPQTGPPGTFTQFATGPVETVSVSYTITSPAGNVTGTKSFSVVAPSGSGNCVGANSGNVLEQQCEEHGFPPNADIAVYEVASFADYTATITTSMGGFHDSGLALVAVQGAQGGCGPVTFGNGVNQASEQFAISNGVVPILTPGKATGGGAIPGATFGFNADSDTKGLKGVCEVMVGPHVVHCVDVTTYTQSGNRATFSGDAAVDGVAARYTIDVTDNGEPGIGKDTFSIATSTGVSDSGVLTAGNIQVHQT